MTSTPDAAAPFDYTGDHGWERDAHRVRFPKAAEPYSPPRVPSTSGLMHAVLDALPTTDPVGAIAAALHRHDQVLQRLLADLARRDGLTDAQARVRYGLPPEGDA